MYNYIALSCMFCMHIILCAHHCVIYLAALPHSMIITLFIAPPMITTESSTVYGFIGSLTLSCTSEGSPPHTFTWRIPGGSIMQSDNIIRVTHTTTAAVYRAEYTIDVFSRTSHTGTYTCIVRNPLGSDSHSMRVDYVTGRLIRFQCVFLGNLL